MEFFRVSSMVLPIILVQVAMIMGRSLVDGYPAQTDQTFQARSKPDSRTAFLAFEEIPDTNFHDQKARREAEESFSPPNSESYSISFTTSADEGQIQPFQRDERGDFSFGSSTNAGSDNRIQPQGDTTKGHDSVAKRQEDFKRFTREQIEGPFLKYFESEFGIKDDDADEEKTTATNDYDDNEAPAGKEKATPKSPTAGESEQQKPQQPPTQQQQQKQKQEVEVTLKPLPVIPVVAVTQQPEKVKTSFDENRAEDIEKRLKEVESQAKTATEELATIKEEVRNLRTNLLEILRPIVSSRMMKNFGNKGSPSNTPTDPLMQLADEVAKRSEQ